MWEVWLSAFHAPALAIADELGVFARLNEQPSTVGELARALKIELRAAEALTGLMSALGFLVQVEECFHLTEIAHHYLLPESPFYWGGFLKRIREIPLDCSKFIAQLRRDGGAREARVSDLWQAPKPSVEQLRDFTHAMHAHSFALATRVAPALPIQCVGRLLDVAGGSGSFSIALARRHPMLQCTVLDLPAVCDVTSEYIRQHQVVSQVQTLAADMFVDTWPAGFDCLFFSDVLHDWDDDRCRLLAERAFASLPSGGRIWIHEMLLAATKDAPPSAAAYSLVMVLVTQGRQRTAAEIRGILEAVGFGRIGTIPTSGGYAVIEGIKD
jgi:acetylserotonin N-methyltransferase